MALPRCNSVLLLVFLGACSHRGAVEEPQPAMQGTVFDDTVETLERARGVQDTVLQQKEQLDQQLSESEGRDRP